MNKISNSRTPEITLVHESTVMRVLLVWSSLRVITILCYGLQFKFISKTTYLGLLIDSVSFESLFYFETVFACRFFLEAMGKRPV